MIELVVLGATLAFAAGVSGAKVRRRIVAARTFERYARWRAHEFVPAPRPGASPRVHGTKDDVAFTIDLVRMRGYLKTRVAAAVLKGPGAKVAVVQRSAIGRALDARAPGESEVGVAAFDGAYRMHGMSAEEARAWLEKTLAHLVCLDERRDVWLGSDGATATVSWSGVEVNPLLLDAAAELAVSLAAWHRPETPYR